jgi:hypothetical protein
MRKQKVSHGGVTHAKLPPGNPVQFSWHLLPNVALFGLKLLSGGMSSVQKRAVLFRGYNCARAIAFRLFSIPLLGYTLRIGVGVLKLPRLNMHLRRLASQMERMQSELENPPPPEGHLEARYSRLTALETAWRQNIPAFMNAVGTVPSIAYEVAMFREQIDRMMERLDQLSVPQHSPVERTENAAILLDSDDKSNRAMWEGIGSVRHKILFEKAHGNRWLGQQAAREPVTRRIIARVKVAEARAAQALRLNLGCGNIPIPGYINVDYRNLPCIDVIAEVGDLPFEPGSVDEIFSAHLLEHFPQQEMRQRLLPYWHGLLRKGGVFRAIIPDAAAMVAGAAIGTYDFADFRNAVFGGQDCEGNCHFNLFTPDSLRALLETAGFTDIKVPVAGRRNGKCFEFEVIGRKV